MILMAKRTIPVAIATMELAHFVRDMTVRHDMTYDEVLYVLANQISMMTKNGILFEELEEEKRSNLLQKQEDN